MRNWQFLFLEKIVESNRVIGTKCMSKGQREIKYVGYCRKTEERKIKRNIKRKKRQGKQKDSNKKEDINTKI